MGVAQIENPALAFDSAGQDVNAVVSSLILTLPCSAAVTQFTIVAITYSISTSEYSVATATAGAGFQGIALDTTTVAGQLTRVVIYGTAQVVTAGSLTAGVVFSATTGGQATTASATIGSNIGIILTTSSGSQTVHCFVGKM